MSQADTMLSPVRHGQSGESSGEKGRAQTTHVANTIVLQAAGDPVCPTFLLPQRGPAAKTGSLGIFQMLSPEVLTI